MEFFIMMMALMIVGIASVFVYLWLVPFLLSSGSAGLITLGIVTAVIPVVIATLLVCLCPKGDD